MLQDICSICLESFVVTDRVRILPCSHGKLALFIIHTHKYKFENINAFFTVSFLILVLLMHYSFPSGLYRSLAAKTAEEMPKLQAKNCVPRRKSGFWF